MFISRRPYTQRSHIYVRSPPVPFRFVPQSKPENSQLIVYTNARDLKNKTIRARITEWREILPRVRTLPASVQRKSLLNYARARLPRIKIYSARARAFFTADRSRSIAACCNNSRGYAQANPVCASIYTRALDLFRWPSFSRQ